MDEVQVSESGEFELYGWENDDCLNINIIIEHGCTKGRSEEEIQSNINVYSEFPISLSALHKHNYELNQDFELRYMKAHRSWPQIHIYRHWLYYLQT